MKQQVNARICGTIGEPGALSTPRLRPIPREGTDMAKRTRPPKICALDGCCTTFPARVGQRYCSPDHRDANARCSGCGVPTRPNTSQTRGKEGGGRYCTPCARQRENARTLKKYSLTVAGYEILLVKQDGGCAICRSIETTRGRDGKPRRLVVDHDHLTGIVRGLLCSRCNVAIGMFDDDIERFTAAIAYLRSA